MKLLSLLLSLLLISISTQSKADSEMIKSIDCLTEAIYFEGRNQPYRGQLAIGHVIMNRVKSKRWPNTVCGVIRQQAQFSYFWDGKPERMTERFAKHLANSIAREIYFGYSKDFTGGADHYFATYIKRPKWAKRTVPMLRIGDHIFHKQV